MPEFLWYIIGAVGVAFVLYFLMILALVLGVIFGKKP